MKYLCAQAKRWAWSCTIHVSALICFMGATFAYAYEEYVGDFTYEFYNYSGYTISPDVFWYRDVDLVRYIGGMKLVDIPGTLFVYGKAGPVNHIRSNAFINISNLKVVLISAEMRSIGNYAFSSCKNLAGVYFNGIAPSVGTGVFNFSSNAIVYYKTNTTGWEAMFAGRPTAPWPIDEEYSYTTNFPDTNTITITGYAGNRTTAIFPSVFLSNSNLAVTAISAEALKNNSNITSVLIGHGITNIGPRAFQSCPSLTNVFVPDSVISIGDGAFQYCRSLKNVALGTNLVNIGTRAFQSCLSLTNVFVPDSVISIGDGAFQYCRSLKNVALSTNLVIIGSWAFESCTNLTSITIPASVTSFGGGAFYGCSRLTNITIPRGAIGIGEEAFSSCANLTAITVDTNNALYSSSSGVLFNKDQTILIQYPAGKSGSYMIPITVTSIAEGAFKSCCSLAAIIVSDFHTVYSSEDGVLFNKSKTTLLHYPGGKTGSYTVPSIVTSIGNSAFFGCTNLTGVMIQNAVTSIGRFAFRGCNGLTTATIPNSVTTIGDRAFYDCAKLAGVTIGRGASLIGECAFAACPSLLAITVNSNNLDYVSVAGALFDSSGSIFLQYPAGKVGSYMVPEAVTWVGSYAFEGCAGLSRIYFPGDSPGSGTTPFLDANLAVVYYFPEASGWGTTFGGCPTAPWVLEVPSDGSLGIRTNLFGFNLYWPSGQTAVVEASTNLINPVWIPLVTNTFTGAPYYFSDSQWTNFRDRFYRIISWP